MSSNSDSSRRNFIRRTSGGVPTLAFMLQKSSAAPPEDWDPNERPAPGQDVIERVGQLLAEAVLVYGDGSEQRLPIRRGFEVNSPSIDWGHLCFQAD